MSRLISKQTLGITFTIFSGIGVAVMPTSAKLAYESGSDMITVAVSRGIVATTVLLLILLILKEKLSLPRDLLRSSLISGGACVAFVYGIYGAILYTNISLVILIIYLYPITVALYEHITKRSRLSNKQWGFALLVCLGLVFIVGVEFENISLIGIALSFLGLLGCVVATLANYTVTQRIGSLRSNLYMSLWSAIVFCFSLWFFGEFKEPNSATGWAGLAANGLGYCIAWVAFFAGARILGPTRASMITLIDPPMAAFVSWLIFEEMLTTYQWVGFAIVMMSLVGFEIQSRASNHESSGELPR